MMFHWAGSINRNQRGFTLLEVTLAILIGGLITAGITATVLQLFVGSERSNNHMTAINQVQSAGYWISHDAQMAETVVIAGLPGTKMLKLDWKDWDGTANQVIYSLESMAGGTLKQLQRTFWTSSTAGETTRTTIIAEYIDPTKCSCNWSNGMLALKVTATVNGHTETREYDVIPRVSL